MQLSSIHCGENVTCNKKKTHQQLTGENMHEEKNLKMFLQHKDESFSLDALEAS